MTICSDILYWGTVTSDDHMHMMSHMYLAPPIGGHTMICPIDLCTVILNCDWLLGEVFRDSNARGPLFLSNYPFLNAPPMKPLQDYHQ